MRTYITPIKLHKCNDNIPDTCIKCNEARGTLCHCILECVKVKSFWQDIINMIDQFLSKPFVTVDEPPKLCYDPLQTARPQKAQHN